VDSIGLPLDYVVSYLDSHGFIMDWLDFYRTAVQEGWPPDRTYHRLTEVVGDVYGPKFREQWETRMRLILRDKPP
jgi:hypothetical protein